MIVASRLLKVRKQDTDVAVAIRIFAPTRGSKSWACRYEIDWPSGTKAMTSGGIDSVQALFCALQMIGADLYTSSYHSSGNLRFEAPGAGYGFPVPSTLRHLLVGDDASFGA